MVVVTRQAYVKKMKQKRSEAQRELMKMGGDFDTDHYIYRVKTVVISNVYNIYMIYDICCITITSILIYIYILYINICTYCIVVLFFKNGFRLLIPWGCPVFKPSLFYQAGKS